MCLQHVYLAFLFGRVICPERQNNAMERMEPRDPGLNPSPATHLLDKLEQASGPFRIQVSLTVICTLQSYGEYWKWHTLNALQVRGTLRVESIIILSFLKSELLQIHL